MTQQPPLTMHASAVVYAGQGVLIKGPSGSGKSSLALQLINKGATLVADDRCELTPATKHVMAQAPLAIAGLIEARGIGILKLSFEKEAKLDVVVDLTVPETDRLPPVRTTEVAGQVLPVLHKSMNEAWLDAFIVYLMSERIDPDSHNVR